MEIIKALRECPAEVQHANLAVRRNGTLIIEEGITSPSNNYLCGTLQVSPNNNFSSTIGQN